MVLNPDPFFIWQGNTRKVLLNMVDCLNRLNRHVLNHNVFDFL